MAPVSLAAMVTDRGEYSVLQSEAPITPVQPMVTPASESFLKKTPCPPLEASANCRLVGEQVTNAVAVPSFWMGSGRLRICPSKLGRAAWQTPLPVACTQWF